MPWVSGGRLSAPPLGRHAPLSSGAPHSAACHCRLSSEYKAIAKFGEKYSRPNRVHSGRSPVCLLYTGGCHYDLLIPRGL